MTDQGTSGTEQTRRRDFLFILRAFGAVFLLCSLLFGGFGVETGNAFPMPPPAELIATGQSSAESLRPVTLRIEPPTLTTDADASPQTIALLLSVALATLAAFNMAICRHLRRVYASSRVDH
jgi:hypothetical protein